MQQSTIALAAVIALVGWRIVARTRRLVGRQRSRLWRHRATVLVLPFLVGLLFVGALGETPSLLALAAGTALGGMLAVVGFRRTHFEVTAEGEFFYTPCGPIGVALAAVLIARFVYQGFAWLEGRIGGAANAPSFALTPMTLVIFATLAIYYSAYSLGLLLWRARAARR